MNRSSCKCDGSGAMRCSSNTSKDALPSVRDANVYCCGVTALRAFDLPWRQYYTVFKFVQYLIICYISLTTVTNIFAPIAQLVEQIPLKDKVVGSIPTGRTNIHAQLHK